MNAIGAGGLEASFSPTASQEGPSFRNSLKRMAPILLGTKIALLLVSWLSIRLAGPGGLHSLFAPLGIPLFAWDSLNYLQILDRGYPDIGQAPQLIAFFPAYPLVSRVLAFGIGGPAALLVVANLCSLAGYSIFHTWCQRLSDARIAMVATLIAISYPPAFFTSCAYTEGPFVLAAASVLALLTAKRWLAAALVCAGATSLRPTGVILAALVSLTRLAPGFSGKPIRHESRVRALLVAAGLGVIASSGAIAYEVFLAERYADPTIYLAAQKNWSDPAAIPATPTSAVAEARELPLGQVDRPQPKSSIPRQLAKLVSIGAWNKLFAFLILAVSGLALVRPRLFPRLLLLIPIAIFLLGYLPGGGARDSSVARFLTGALPTFFYVAPALAKRPRLAYGALVGCWVMQLIFVAAFSRGIWTG